VLAQYQSGAQTRRVPELAAAAGEPFVEVREAVAADLGVSDGDLVRVTSRRGTAIVAARVGATIRPDTIFLPFHWPGAARANSLTLDALDPTSRMPQFKCAAARLERLAPPGTPEVS
jgi:assimilatory nitrate reductase catalytic subunit